MAAARPVFNSVPRVSSPASGECLLIPDQASPLLKPRRTHARWQTIFERWRIAWSSFLDGNSGLLLVLASHFLSAMGVAVKWLNGLDGPVPTLELIIVRMVRSYAAPRDRRPMAR
ncbi:hypothetical protein EDB83DRAFT_2387806 [Lactarius deliciosus]|nr:hypothetical protein EDB83DRAFT_2387806 [Lactarius deliciosus]